MEKEFLVLPTSFAQQRLWFLNQMQPDSSLYNIPLAFNVRGILNIKALEQALNMIIRRHESLRTNFALIDGSPFQIISNENPVSLLLIDLSQLSDEAWNHETQKLILHEAQKPFNLLKNALLRTTLIRRNNEEYILLITMHHIIFDDWSIGTFLQELSMFYENVVTEKSLSLVELPLQYADFASWQRQEFQGEVLETQISYWKKQLENLPTLQLPIDYPRKTNPAFSGATKSFRLPKILCDSLKALSREEGATLFMTLLAAFQSFIYRYTNQNDIAVGSPIANRNRADIENLIGFFSNTLVLRTQFSDNPTFRKLLKRVKNTTLEAYDHQDLPFEKLVDKLQLERNLSYAPLFQVMFVFQNSSTGALKLPGATINTIESYTNTAKFDITLLLEEIEEGLFGTLEYSTELFKAATINRMVEHFQILLEGIVSAPDLQISELPLLLASEQQQMLKEWNKREEEKTDLQCIHELFEKQAAATPEAIAIVYKNQELTYQQLNEKANKLAHYLRKQGVKPEVLVGVCVERSLEMMIGILGILKAGGAYVPLDPSYPQQRLSFIINEPEFDVRKSRKTRQSKVYSNTRSLN